jgi:hypothetical protein
VGAIDVRACACLCVPVRACASLCVFVRVCASRVRAVDLRGLVQALDVDNRFVA